MACHRSGSVCNKRAGWQYSGDDMAGYNATKEEMMRLVVLI